MYSPAPEEYLKDSSKQPTYPVKSDVWRTLDPTNREIRLLRLLPVPANIPRYPASLLDPGALDHLGSDILEPLHAELEILSLNDNPSYEALSYCWGDASDVLPLWLQSSAIKVTASLYTGLRRLRLRDRPRRLWADAICINQRNMVERSQQVQVMGQIYKAAGKVLIWLGEDVDALIGSWRDRFISSYIESKPGTDLREFVPFVITDHMPWQRAVIRVTDSIFSRPWFRRIWVIQEVVLAKDFEFQCGGSRYSSETIARLFERLKNDYLWKAVAVTFDHDEDLAIGHTSHQLGVISWLRRRADPSQAGGELVIFEELRRLDCTDPRDRVYGLLGLTDLNAEVDYGKSVEQVYLDAAIAALNSTKSLRILFCAGLSGRSSETEVPPLPSWVPDWRMTESVMRGPSEVITWWQIEELYNASGLAAYYFDFAEEKTLIIAGIVVDTIAEVLEVTELDEEFDIAKAPSDDNMDWFRGEPLLRRLDEWKVVLQHLPLETFWSVVLRNVITEDPNPYWHRRRLTRLDCEKLERDYVLHKPPGHDMADRVVRTQIATQLEANHPCTTGAGRPGQVPLESHVGDKICVLVGTKIPFVLRPVPQTSEMHFAIVGPCYIDGIMDGEAVAARLQSLGVGAFEKMYIV